MKIQKNKMQRTRNEVLFDLGFWSILAAIMLFGISQKANAWNTFDNMEGIYFPEAMEIRYDFYDDLCLDGQAEQIESAIRYFTYEMSFADSTRTYSYIGRRDSSSWGHWDRFGESILITVECNYPSQLPAGVEGMAIPILGYDETIFADAGVVLSNGIPDYRIQKVTVHELGHAIGLDHSTTAGATMRTGMFSTPVSAQFQETLSRDDWCGIKDKLGEDMVHWPMTRTTVDDQANFFMPYVPFNGEIWEAWLIFVPEKTNWVAGLASKPIQSCEDLAQ